VKTGDDVSGQTILPWNQERPLSTKCGSAWWFYKLSYFTHNVHTRSTHLRSVCILLAGMNPTMEKSLKIPKR